MCALDIQLATKRQQKYIIKKILSRFFSTKFVEIIVLITRILRNT